ncbi:mevalonate kinase [Candidatus Gottesmanbacteria bacterium]|nr:mevalonate kinase [Candidatus Gottesmanbacteria bacterium]
MIIVSAPSKIHLLGEHVVVYGRPALLAAIDKRLYVKIKNQKSKVPGLAKHGAGKNQKKVTIYTKEKDDLIWETIEVFKKSFSIDKLPPLEITITSQIPTGCGLGSSAALSAALIGALMKSVKNLWNPGKINELTYTVEKIAHGNPSGADNTTVVFGGLVWYRREFEFLKSIWSLPISLYKFPKFGIIDSGRPQEGTREMVSFVTHQYKKNNQKMDEIFYDQENQTKNLLLSLKNNDNQLLITSLKKGEENLEKIGVVGKISQKIIREIESLGGAAKVCGAGGRKKASGVILCYHSDLSIINNVMKKYNLSVSPIKLGEEGIRIEQ